MSTSDDRHGYARYSNPRTPCRCAVCRRAKADYTRERRAAARALAQRHTKRAASGLLVQRHFVPSVTHGYAAYCDSGCRCNICLAAKRANSEAWNAVQRARRAAARRPL